MSVELLGPHFDIHGGGMDLKFPHHENEIAQTCAACDSKFVNVWMHNGFVRVDDEKMSKSLGNFFTVREVLEWVRDPEVVRYFMINSHYRGPINYTPESLAQADAALERLYLALRGVPVATEFAATVVTRTFRRPRWTTTSIRRWPWPNCSSWRARSTRPRRPATSRRRSGWRRKCAGSQGDSGCSGRNRKRSCASGR